MFLIRSGAIDGYERLVTDLGGNPVHLLAAVGFSPPQLRNPNTYVSYSGLAQLLELSARACHEPLFGLLLSRSQSSTVLGDIGLAIAQQSTVGEALSSINRYLYLHARGVYLEQNRRGSRVQLELNFDISSPLGLDQLRQLSIGQLLNFLCELLHLESVPRGLQAVLRQAPNDGAGSALSGQLLSRIAFDNRADGISFPASWLQRETHRDQEALRRHFQRNIADLQQRYPDGLLDQVREIIGRLLPSGECSIERVAATLGLTTRVLQKRLRRERSSYSGLLRQTRIEIAEQHLLHGSMGITDLALYLGYADVAVFSRNFKSWRGVSPSQWQHRPNEMPTEV
jgi:AraC-like DNA-binding protein